jgi:hypothetical protein
LFLILSFLTATPLATAACKPGWFSTESIAIPEATCPALVPSSARAAWVALSLEASAAFLRAI